MPLVSGSVLDQQGQPVLGAHVSLGVDLEAEAIAEATTQPDGSFALTAPENLPGTLVVRIDRAHFQAAHVELDATQIQSLRDGQSLALADTALMRRISAAFWIATLVFVAVLALIATGKLHNTLAALVGASLLFAVSYLGHPLLDDLFIFDFKGALNYIDWNVIFLIMGMMIVIAVIENTGIFQWLAFFAYRVSGGRMWLLLPILMLITGVASAFLDNVTTMLLMTPITVQIALSLGHQPAGLTYPGSTGFQCDRDQHTGRHPDQYPDRFLREHFLQ